MTTRHTLWIITLAIALLQLWNNRFEMWSDGIAYLDVASRLEVNTYWSPLFSWLLIPVVHLVPLRWSATAVHLLQVVFALLAVLLADRLWQRLAPETAQDRGWLITRWAAAWWMVFELTSIGLVQPDGLTVCLYLTACLLVLHRRPVLLGVVLAAGYLAKAAMLPFALILLACWWFVERRRAMLAAAILCLCCAPWWIALHQRTGRWTIGDSGPLNYAWEVNGLTRWMHGQGGPHSTRQISSAPDAFVYPTPFTVTYPPFYEPSYWYAGLENQPFSLTNQLRALKENGIPLLWRWLAMPGFMAVLALSTRIRDWRGIGSEVRSRWLLLLPAVATAGMYAAVFFDKRYVAAQLFLLGTIPLRAAYLRAGPPAAWIFPIAACTALLPSLSAEMKLAVDKLLADGISSNLHATVVGEIHAAGAPPGTAVALIGLTLQPEWARQGRLRIVGDVPFRYSYTHEPGPNRELLLDTANVERFWQVPAPVRQKIYDGFAQAGARFVIAHEVPEKADTTGWTRLNTKVNLISGCCQTFWIRPLTPPADPPATHAAGSAAPTPAAARDNAAPKIPPGPG
ncbi:MAG: DUF2029 domain-containing protein [Acidobacteriaceae bacterium]|nr:DUF2029 domain-containing protein [Acidobacteriaceae bacterium]